MDCGKNTFENGDDWHSLRNRLWRQLVPRDKRHGMICRACIERRLGRSLIADDLRKPADDESSPEDQPMQREDYGIIDSLSPQTIQVIDSAMIDLVRSRPREVISIVRHMVEEPSAAIPWLPDWFYLDRISELIATHALTIVIEDEDLRSNVVTAAAGLTPGHRPT